MTTPYDGSNSNSNSSIKNQAEAAAAAVTVADGEGAGGDGGSITKANKKTNHAEAVADGEGGDGGGSGSCGLLGDRRHQEEEEEQQQQKRRRQQQQPSIIRKKSKNNNHDNSTRTTNQKEEEVAAEAAGVVEEKKNKKACVDSDDDGGEDDDPYLLHKKDIWIHILSFLGPGNFIFIAGISKTMKEYYLEYFNTLKQEEIPKVHRQPYYNEHGDLYFGFYRVPISTNTYMSSALSSVACAEYWNKDTKGCDDRLPNGEICWKVAGHGNVEVLKWARYQQEFPWHQQIDYMASAALRGRLDILQYLHLTESPFGEGTFSFAVEGGNMDCIKYLHEIGCPWEAFTCSKAAEYDRLDVLQYLHDNGCPWEARTCSNAVLVPMQPMQDLSIFYNISIKMVVRGIKVLVTLQPMEERWKL